MFLGCLFPRGEDEKDENVSSLNSSACIPDDFDSSNNKTDITLADGDEKTEKREGGEEAMVTDNKEKEKTVRVEGKGMEVNDQQKDDENEKDEKEEEAVRKADGFSKSKDTPESETVKGDESPPTKRLMPQKK